MDPAREATFVAGLLYLLRMVSGLLSVAPSVDGKDFMVSVAANRASVLRAGFFQVVMFPADVGIAVALYPVLRTHGEGLAVGFASLRIGAGLLVLMGVLLLLLLLMISQEFVEDDASAGGPWQVLGRVLRHGRDLVNHVAMVFAVGGGSLLLYWLLFQADLVPRWLSGWGVAGVVMAMVGSVLVMCRLISVTSFRYVALTLPFAAQELAFAAWLIFRGLHA